MRGEVIRSALFVFEGPDGVGKSTLAARLHNFLKKKAASSELLSFPGKEAGTLGRHIYQLYHDPRSFKIGRIPLISEQLMFTAAHAEVIQRRILPTLSKGGNVVLDRYWWSTWVHSTVGGLSPQIRDMLLKIESCLWEGVRPNCVFLVNRNQPAESEHSRKKWRHLVSLYNEIRKQQANYVNIVDVENSNDLNGAVRIVLNTVKANPKPK